MKISQTTRCRMIRMELWLSGGPMYKLCLEEFQFSNWVYFFWKTVQAPFFKGQKLYTLEKCIYAIAIIQLIMSSYPCFHVAETIFIKDNLEKENPHDNNNQKNQRMLLLLNVSLERCLL